MMPSKKALVWFILITGRSKFRSRAPEQADILRVSCWFSWRGLPCLLCVQVALHCPPFNLHIRRIDHPANLHHVRAAACELASYPTVFLHLCCSKRNMLGP